MTYNRDMRIKGKKIKSPKVTENCIKNGHKCMTCREKMRYINRSLLQIIIRYLKRHPKASIQELSEILDYPKYAIEYALEKLERDGLIEKE